MKFLDALKAYLRDVERGAQPGGARPIQIDLAIARRHVLEALERASPTYSGLAEWTDRERVESFLVRTCTELLGGLCAGGTAKELQAYVHAVVDAALNLPLQDFSAVQRAEVRRVADDVVAHIESPVLSTLPRYAFELRLVHAWPHTITSLGRVLLGLPETDAITWLLLLETQQSLGSDDRWRTPIDVVRLLTSKPRGWFHDSTFLPDEEVALESVWWPASDMVRSRLDELGVTESWKAFDEHDWEYDVIAPFRSTLAEIAAEKSTPLRVLAETLLAEERGAVVAHLAPSSVVTEDDAALRALDRHARMVAHELHNAMTPTQHALRKLYDALQQHAPAGSWQTYQQRVDRGVERVLRFADEMASASSLAVSAALPFDPASAIRDAIAELNGALGERVLFAPQRAGVTLRGHRHRFVMVMVNLLRNAVQSRADGLVRVRVDMALDAPDRLRVAVHDDGPGIAEAHREAVFQPGFSLREGGLGQGLALVRDVVERELGGNVRYESSDLSGACLALVVPVSPGSAP